MKKTLIPTIFWALLVFPQVASALSLDEAKAKHLVGETISGYLEAVSTKPSAEVAALVADINSQRKAKYQEIATRNGTGLAAVEALAAKKAIEKTPAGEMIKLPSGEWLKKAN